MSKIIAKTLKNAYTSTFFMQTLKSATIPIDYKYSNDNDNKRKSYRLLLATGGVVCWSFYYLTSRKKVYNATSSVEIANSESFVAKLPTYTLDEVAKHNTRDNRIWVTYRNGVYDITDFVEVHPGGDKILMAAGGALEPFWTLYAVHNSSEIQEILEDMRIGNVKEGEKTSKQETYDPYENEPHRHPLLKPVSEKPFNAECRPDILVESYFTPNDLFFVRNHLPVPKIDPNEYELEIELEDSKKTFTLSLDDLKKFPKHSVEATIMCAGNRRSEMTKIKAVKGLDWGTAAVGNAVWSGPKLYDVLQKVAGVTDSSPYNHIQFEGYDVDVTNHPYGASVPFWKGTDKRCEVILAYEMNGEPLPRDHGYPVRVVIPGVVGARNVKWLNRIILSKHESNAHWQQNDYKGFNPSTDWDTVDFKKSPAIQELPVISAICSPLPGERVHVEDGFITVKGYAWSGGGSQIVRIDVTKDEGKFWYTATIEKQSSKTAPNHFSWTLWSCKIPVNSNEKEVEIWSKAVDSNYNTQPESFHNIWNLRGVLNNAYHRVKLILEH